MEKKPRPHVELIRQWADGAEIQYRKPGAEVWFDCADPAWVSDYEYRVKPERKYPQTQVDACDLLVRHDSTLNMRGEDGGRHAAVIAVANLALRHAIDNGQVVTREEFDRMCGDFESRELAIASEAARAMYNEIHSGPRRAHCDIRLNLSAVVAKAKA